MYSEGIGATLVSSRRRKQEFSFSWQIFSHCCIVSIIKQYITLRKLDTDMKPCTFLLALVLQLQSKKKKNKTEDSISFLNSTLIVYVCPVAWSHLKMMLHKHRGQNSNQSKYSFGQQSYSNASISLVSEHCSLCIVPSA